MIRHAAKTAALASMIGAFFADTLVRRAPIKGEIERRRFYVRQNSRYSHAALKAMGIELKTFGFEAARFRNRNYLIVSNHMSYLDVLLLTSVVPSVFVTSVDMGATPVLGEIAVLGGSIFVERRNRSQVERDLSAMSQALKDGFNVAIYPEGTSTNGRAILPFKKSLLMAAAEAGVDIQPVCLKYCEIDGEPFSPANADKVCWYGEMSFVPHFLGLLGLKSLKAELHFLNPIQTRPDSTRSELAEACERAICDKYDERPSLDGQTGKTIRSEADADGRAAVNAAEVRSDVSSVV